MTRLRFTITGEYDVDPRDWVQQPTDRELAEMEQRRLEQDAVRFMADQDGYRADVRVVSTPQQQAALARANRFRQARARLRVALKTGEVTVTDARHLVLDPPDYLHTIRVGVLVGWLPGVGATRARRILRQAGVPLDAKLERLTRRQRIALQSAIGEWDVEREANARRRTAA